MKEYQVSYRGNRLVTRDNIIDVLNELGYQPGGGEGGLRLISITSWYKKTTESENVTVDNPENPGPGWQIGFVLPDPTNRYVWKFSDYHYGDPDHEEIEGFHIYTNCELVSVYASPDTSMGIDFVYALFDKEILSVTLTDGSGDYPVTSQTPTAGWTRDLSSLAYGADAYLWMSQRRTGEGQTWSIPVRLSGEDGSPGADGLNIQFSYKHMNRLPNSSSQLPEDNPYTQGVSDNEIPDGWRNHPSGVGYFTELNGGVEEEVFYRYEWATYRLRKEVPEGSIIWDPWSSPFIWSAYGEKGMDGDGVEYVYKREWSGSPEDVDHPSEDFIPTVANPIPDAPSGPIFIYGEDSETGQGGIEQSWNKGVYLIANTDPANPNNWRPEGWDGGFNRWKVDVGSYDRQGEWVPKGWEDDPQGVDENHKKEYVSQRKRVNGVWGSFSTPTVWATFSKEHTIWIDPETGLWWIDGQETNIKAEGKNGKGIDLKGRVTLYSVSEVEDYQTAHPNETVTTLEEAEENFELTENNIGDCFVVEKGDNGGHIYLYLGPDENDNWEDNWQDFGEFQGEGSYVHIAWAHYYGPDEFGQPSVRGFVIDRTANPIEYEWMGICTNHEENDPGIDRFTEYKWNYVHGRDGDTFERVYVRTTQKTVPPTIGKNQSEEYDSDYLGHTYQGDEEYIPWVGNYSECGSENHGSESTPQYRFTDDPLGPNLTYPYEWMAERKKVDGVWQDFNTPSIHSNYSHDGQSIVRSTVFKRSITAPIAPYGGSFLSPYPTDTDWKDGLPTGEGPIWMSSKIFTSDEQDPQDGLTWPTPTLLRDSEDLDIEFSNQPKTGTPIPPIDYDKPGGNRHNPEEPSGYDHSATGGKKQLWFDPEQDATYISAHATEFNWMATRTSFYNASNDSMEWRDWVILLIKGETGEAGATFEHAYLVFPDEEDIFDYWPPTAPTTAAETPPSSITVTNSQGTTTYDWVFNTTAGVTVGPEQVLWMTERKVSSSIPGPWSRPVKISGNGTPGEDAEDIEFIYKRSNSLPDPEDDRPTFGPGSNETDSSGHKFEDDDFVPGTCSGAPNTTNEGWYDNPSGVDPEHKYEWMCQRVKPRGIDQVWQDWSNVFVWSAYGDTGMDGDGIEYVYTRVSNPTKPNRPKIQRTSSDSTYINWNGGVENTGSSQNPVWEPKDYTGNFYGWVGGEYNSQGEWVPNGWTDDPKGVGIFPNPSYVPSDPNSKENIIYYKEYVSQRKRVNGVWGDFSDPAIWSTKAQQFHIENGNWVDEEGNIIGQAEGDQGQGIQLKGTVDVIYDSQKGTNQKSLQEINPKLYPALYGDIQPGDCYVVRANRHLYVCLHDTTNWNRDRESADNWEPTLSPTNSDPNWEDVGEFQGEPGQGSYMHIAWASSNDRLHYQTNNIVFTNGVITEIKYYVTAYEDKDPQTEYDWMGVLTDHEIDDLDSNYGDVSYDPEDDRTWNWKKYKWNHVRGRDGDNYERVYLRTKTELKPGFKDNYINDSNYQEPEYLPEVSGYNSSNPQHSGIVNGNKCTFTDDPVGVEASWPYEWAAERKKKLDSTTNIVRWFEFSEPSLWARYSFDGNPGVGIQTRYTVALIKTGLTISNPSGETPRSTYTDSNNQSHTITWQEGTAGLIVGSTNEGVYYLWMTQRSGYTGNWENWTTPIRISGEDGKPGVDGPGIEFIFKRQGTEPDPPGTTDYNNKTYQDDDYVPQYWEDSPVGVDNTPDTKYEWSCQRVKLDGVWQAWSPVFLWSAYGETGMDGDGVEYVYFRRADAPATPIGPRARKKSNNNNKLPWYGGIEDLGNTQTHNWSPKNWDVTTNGAWSTWEWDSDAGYYNSQGEWIPKAYNINGTVITDGSGGHVYWSDDPSGVTKNDGERLEWVSVRRRVNGVWDDFTSPKLWASFGSHVTIVNGYWVIDGIQYGKAEGEDGKGIALKGSVDFLTTKELSDYRRDNPDHLSSTALANLKALQQIQPGDPNGLGITSVEIGDCYVVRKNRYLYTSKRRFDTDSTTNDDWYTTDQTIDLWWENTNNGTAGPGQQNWAEVGEFQGADGESNYIHIAWATDEAIERNNDGTIKLIHPFITRYEELDSDVSYDWMGVFSDENELDPVDNYIENSSTQPNPLNWTLYKWNHVKGKDGSDYEKVYIKTKSENTIPAVNQNGYSGSNEGHNNPADDEFYPQVQGYSSISYSNPTFTDDPTGVSAEWPYEWVTERKKKLNSTTQRMEWGEFNSPATLWATYSFDGMSAYLTRGSDSVTVDAAGNVVGGYGNSSNPRIYTEVKIYDPKKDNGNGTYGGYLSYTSNTTVGANQFKLSATGTNCTANKTSTGKVYVNPITSTSSDNCSIAITATISNGKTFTFNFPVTLNHIPQTYLTYTLTNDSDVFTYRTRNQQYDGLPIETCLEVQTTDGTVDSLGDNTLKENGYVKSVTVVGKGDTNFLRYAKIGGTNVTNKTILVEADTTSSSTSITHTTKTITIYKDSGRSQDTGLRLEIKSDGNIKLYRTGTTDLDLEDTKHDLDISCVAVLGDVEYQSPIKTFSLSEKNDITLYKLVLSSDTFIKDETGGYSPLENTFNVKVNVSDETGTTIVTPDSSSGLVRGNVKVMFINGAPATTPRSDTLSLLSSLDFSNINNNFFTVVVVEYNSSNQPILYHDVETVDIVPPGVSQVWMDYTPDRFVVDCDADGIILSTTTDTVRTLNISAYLRWGNLVCTDFDTSNTKITLQNIGSGNYVISTALNRNTTTGEVSIGFRFSSGKALTSGQAKIRIKGTFSNGISKDVTKYVTIEANRTGDTGQPGDFKSTAFIKTYTDIRTWLPTGGTYSSPKPTGFSGHDMPTGAQWEDGIPAGEETLWSSTAIFYGSGATHTWSFPKIVRDSETYDVEFAFKQSNGNVPNLPVKYDEATTTNKCNAHRPTSPNTSICDPQIWYDPEEDSGTIQSNYDKFYWKAEREIINGSKKPWVITQIKGESEPNVMCDTPIIVIETDPTGKLSSSENTFTFKTWLRLGETIQIPTSQTSSDYNNSVIDSIDDTFQSSDNSVEWEVTLISNTVLSNTGITITMSNASCSASKTIQIVFERKNQSQVKSFVFKRFASQSAATLGKLGDNIGSFSEPGPGTVSGSQTNWNGWSDGLPSTGTNPIYMSSRLFTSDGLSPQQSSWSSPVRMSDTDVFDVEFSFEPLNPGKPGDSGKVWYDPSGNPPSGKTWADAIWMATNTKNSSGSWSGWVVVKIKGETGDTGTGISSITPWYKAFDTLDVTIPSPTDSTQPLTAAGWTNGYVKPTKENPYLWKFTRTVYENPSSVVHDGLEMIQVWSENMINPNLLDDTDFSGFTFTAGTDTSMGAWDNAWKMVNVHYGKNAGINIIPNNIPPFRNHNYFGGIYDYGTATTSYIVVLKQFIFKVDENLYKVNSGNWYTLSFWMRGNASTSFENAPLELKFLSRNSSDGNSTDLIDTSAGIYLNDIYNSTGITIIKYVHERIKNNSGITYNDVFNNEWKLFTVTFKIKDTIPSDVKTCHIEWYLSIPSNTNNENEGGGIYICMPKLEIGKVATDYISGDAIKDPYPRLTVWDTGKQYYQGKYGEPYLDAVTYGANWFRCRNTHISSDSNKPVVGQTTAYWEPAQNLDFIVTDLLLAETAFIKNLTVGGLRTDDMGKPHVEMVGSNINFYGRANFPNIKMNVDEDNMAYLEFYDKNNTFLYDLGPSGIRWKVTVTSASCTQNTLLVKTTATDNNNLPKPDFISGGTIDTSLWKFSPAREDGVVVGDSSYTKNDDSIANRANGKYFTSTTFVKQVNGSWVLDESKYANYMYRRQDELVDTLSTNLGNYNASTINNAIQNWKDDLVMFWNFPSGSISEINDAYTVNNNIATITYPVYRQVYINIVNGFSNTFYAFKQQNTIWMVLA